MKLVPREVELISKVLNARRTRTATAWTIVIFILVAWAVVFYSPVDLTGLTWLLAALSGIAIFEVLDQYFGIRRRDEVEALLLKFVNSDADALKQVANRSESAEVAS